MNRIFPKSPLLALILLMVAFALVGWQLTLHHLVLFVSVLCSTIALVISQEANPWMGGIFGQLPQILLFSLSLSLLITLIFTLPILLTLVVIPVLTTLLAWQEIRLLYPRSVIWRLLLIVALLGVGLGELIDLLILPSAKYY
ncbi:MAG: hypothetical protein IGS50_13110 [Synechococcales cyanobacterium C42_A2020_086]|nr:hypothetical protein [Synechococcales cyanobacterium C42_A2020_086]